MKNPNFKALGEIWILIHLLKCQKMGVEFLNEELFRDIVFHPLLNTFLTAPA